jgi:uncharacterized membrane protein HdeD (DUF308 family)
MPLNLRPVSTVQNVAGNLTGTGEPQPFGRASMLRRLYVVRFGFAVVWAILFALTASDLGVTTGVLLVLYPLVDVAAAVVDARTSPAPARTLSLNIVISSLAAVGLLLAATSGNRAVLMVWGAWAILAGVVQLVVALRRRGLGGQWAMVVSGGISAVAGTSFIVAANQDDPSLTSLAGYAVLGGVFFLVSALRLGRATRAAGSR